MSSSRNDDVYSSSNQHLPRPRRVARSAATAKVPKAVPKVALEAAVGGAARQKLAGERKRSSARCHWWPSGCFIWVVVKIMVPFWTTHMHLCTSAGTVT